MQPSEVTRLRQTRNSVEEDENRPSCKRWLGRIFATGAAVSIITAETITPLALAVMYRNDHKSVGFKIGAYWTCANIVLCLCLIPILRDCIRCCDNEDEDDEVHELGMMRRV